MGFSFLAYAAFVFLFFCSNFSTLFPFMSKPHFNPSFHLPLPLETTLRVRNKSRSQVYCVVPLYPAFTVPVKRQPARLLPVGVCLLGVALGVVILIAVYS